MEWKKDRAGNLPHFKNAVISPLLIRIQISIKVFVGGNKMKMCWSKKEKV